MSALGRRYLSAHCQVPQQRFHMILLWGWISQNGLKIHCVFLDRSEKSNPRAISYGISAVELGSGLTSNVGQGLTCTDMRADMECKGIIYNLVHSPAFSSSNTRLQLSTSMFQLFAFTSRFLYLGNVLQGLARGVLALRNLRTITSCLIPTLSSPHPTHLLDAPIAPLELLEEFRTPSSSGGLIVIEGPPLVLPSAIPTLSYQSSLVTVTPNRLPDLMPLLLFLAFISGFVLLLPGFVYVCATIANRTSAIAHASRKISKAFSFVPIFSLNPIFSLKPLSGLVPYFFPTQISSRHLFVSFSFLLLWTGPVRSLLSPGCSSMLT